MMLRSKKKLFSVLLTLVMIFSLLGTTAFAAPAENNGQYLEGNAIPPTLSADCSAYEVSMPTATTSITVTLVMEAGDAVEDYEVTSGSAFRVPVSITLTNGTAKTFTVYDLLAAVDGANGLSFDITNGSTQYLNAVTHGGSTWEAGQWGMDGWVFRVNDKVPVKETADGLGYEGTAINQTYLSNGDIVHFFYDFPSIISRVVGDVSANNVRGVYETSTATTLTAQLQGHKTFIDQANNYIFSIYNYIDLASGITASLYASDGTTLVGTATSSANGEVTFTGNFTPGETYILQTNSVLFTTTNATWVDRISGAYFVDTGAYSKITIPAI